MTSDAQRTLFKTSLAPILDTAYGVALYMTGDDHAAEEILQAAVIAAYARFGVERPVSGFKLWFLRIVTAEFLARTSEGEPLGAVVAEGPGDNEEARIVAAFAALPGRQRAVCALYFTGDFTYAELAEITGSALETTRQQLHEGRTHMLTLLRPVSASAQAPASRPALALGCA